MQALFKIKHVHFYIFPTILPHCILLMGLLWWISDKEFPCQWKRRGFHYWVGKIPWRRKWQPIPVFLPGKSHGQRNLVDYSSWGRKVSDTIYNHQQQLIVYVCEYASLFLYVYVQLHVFILHIKTSIKSGNIWLLNYFMTRKEGRKGSRSVVPDSLWPHGLLPTRLLCRWDFPGKSTGVGCHFLLQGNLLDQGIETGSPAL